MSITYRVDFFPSDGRAGYPTVLYDLTRQAAMTTARKLSAKHGAAYAIASRYGVDVGQRVYHDGHYSHQDDVFA